MYVLKSVEDGIETEQLKKEGYTLAGAWANKYGIVSFGSSDVVVEKEDGVDVDRLKRPSYYEKVFSDLKGIHHPDHPKGESFRKRVCAKCSNIPIGCKVVQWQINTTMHMGIKGVPYELTYGQRPRVGISNLPLAQHMIDAIATEAQLNQINALRPNELSSNNGHTADVPPAASNTHNGVHTNSRSEEGRDAEAVDGANASTLDTVDKCHYPDCPHHGDVPVPIHCEKQCGESRCPRKLHHLCQTEREMKAWRKK